MFLSIFVNGGIKMIFSAYQGIGKSTLAKNNLEIIDFESSCFDKSNPNWYKDYVNAAINLHKQGYIVFISAHKVVRDYMLQQLENKNDYAMIMYDKNLEVYCLDKLSERFEKSCEEYGQEHPISRKNWNAYQNAGAYFEDSYNEIKEDEKNGLNVIWITDKDYDLESIINNINNFKDGYSEEVDEDYVDWLADFYKCFDD